VSLPQALADVERDLIRDALREAGGNRSEAAKRLGITRPKLYRRMAALFTPEQLAAMATDPLKEKSK
jgi:DNA-binding NtrC family response regulator